MPDQDLELFAIDLAAPQEGAGPEHQPPESSGRDADLALASVDHGTKQALYQGRLLALVGRQPRRVQHGPGTTQLLVGAPSLGGQEGLVV